MATEREDSHRDRRAMREGLTSAWIVFISEHTIEKLNLKNKSNKKETKIIPILFVTLILFAPIVGKTGNDIRFSLDIKEQNSIFRIQTHDFSVRVSDVCKMCCVWCRFEPTLSSQTLNPYLAFGRKLFAAIFEPKVHYIYENQYLICEWKSVIRITVRPKIKVSNQIVFSSVGSDVHLECRCEASPLPTTSWIKSDGTLLQPNVKYQTREEHDSYRTKMKLKITNLDDNDFGAYKCVAKNPLGEKEGLVRLFGQCTASNCSWSGKWKIIYWYALQKCHLRSRLRRGRQPSSNRCRQTVRPTRL